MLELTDYKDYLSERSHQVLTLAIEESKKRHHYYLGVEHLFLALIKVEEAFFGEIVRELNLDSAQILYFVDNHLTGSKQYLGTGMKVSLGAKAVFKIAWEEAQRLGRRVIEPLDLFTAIFKENEGLPVRIFRNFGIEPEIVTQTILIKLKNHQERVEEFKKRFELPPHLKYFGVNLNHLARLGKLPLIIGREREIDQIVEILCHKDRPNSVMIVGETGVGKTAVVEGLALQLEYEPETIPPRLRNYQIINLQMNSIVAGTIFRGMFEDRIEKIIKELKERRNFILFIDEAHSLIGAGSALGVPSDAANIFKSALARGEVQIIGATTLAEYKQYIQEDEALSRRFRPVFISEPSFEETSKILYGIRPRLEKNYGVRISDESIATALTLAPRYMRSLRLPEKTISWLDTACVKAEISHPPKGVLPLDIVEVISQETGIPSEMIFRDVDERFHNIEEALGQRVVGQKEAIFSLARHLRLNKGPLKDNFDRPDGVLLFLGPTGVGKTELAKALAEYLFGDEKKMVRIDMSEYKDSTISVDKLIGMPRGIVGSERGGILTNQIRENPYTVLLLDEMEKASAYVLNLFLQVFDEGFLTDGRGKRVYFSDCIIIMTSNLGSDEFRKYTKPLGFLSDSGRLSSVKKAVLKEVENTFSPEFLNRIDDIIVFSPLTYEEVKTIAQMYLDKINRQLRMQGKGMEVTEEALDLLVKMGFSIKYGARFLKRVIDEKVKIPLTLFWKKGSKFKVGRKDEEIWVNWRN